MKLPITFLSDYGYDDEFAGACRVVIERLAPGTPVLDLTHGITPGDVRRGAIALAAAAPHAGPSVHLAVVDPGVGTDRRAVAIESGKSFLVGPDNGLLSLAAGALGGVTRAIDISASPLNLDPVAPTFHGRDVFAPVAAHLAMGHPLATAGEEMDPSFLEPLELPAPARDGQTLVAHVLYADGFGNVVLDATPDDIPLDTGPVLVEGMGEAPRGRTFADGEGGLVVYDDSAGRLALAIDGGSAAATFGLERDSEVRISPVQ